MKITILLNLVVLLVTAALAPAATRLVPDEYATIQPAIDAAVDGDVVIVAEGIYFENINFKGRNIILRGTDPNNPNVVAATIIDGGRNGSVATFSSGEDANCVLNGFTLTNGCGSEEQFGSYVWSFGGAIYCTGSGPTVTNCIITGNKAIQGAGIFAWENSSLTIANCTISENTRSGGIYCWRNTTATIIDCVISGNDGRGIYCWGSPAANIINCTITNNDMDGIIVSGGDGSLIISNCTISENHYTGIRCSVGSTAIATISNCIITGNTGGWHGGGIKAFAHDDGVVMITNCTITGNRADYGGGVSCPTGETIITNSIVWNNTNYDICLWNFTPLPNGHVPGVPSKLTVSYSCPGIIFVEEDPVRGDPILILCVGNIDVDPCFADPNNGDYHLKSAGWRWHRQRKVWTWDEVTSPCIDAGNPGSPLGDELMSVPDDPNNEWGENLRINMGAYGGTAEASMAPPGWALLSDLSNDGIVNFVDLALQVEDWLTTANEQPGDLNHDGAVNMIDFSILADTWLKRKPFVVKITKPENGAEFYDYETIEIEADAWCFCCSVVKVEFFANGTKIGEDNYGSDGWKTNWEGDHARGSYNLTTKATNDNGATTVSLAVAIRIGGGGPP